MKAAAKSLPSTRKPAVPKRGSSTAPSLLPAMAQATPTIVAPEAPSLPQANVLSVPKPLPSGASKSAVDHVMRDTHARPVDGTTSDCGQSRCDTHSPAAAVPPTPPSEVHGTVGTQSTNDFTALRVWAEMYYDAQKARIACANRAKRGGVDEASYATQLELLEVAESSMSLAMRREYRRVCPPAVREWQKGQRGIGELLLSRLLGCIGHPIHTTPHHWEGTGTQRVLIAEPPMERRVSDLWSYCGHGDADRKRRKGTSPEEAAASGSPVAKMLVHLLAEACMKARGEYREVYDHRREQTAVTHPDWTKGHSHNDALRIVGKTILRDLWLAAQEEAAASEDL